MSDFEEKLDPGIRELALELIRNGYATTDSGDGTNYANGMEGALPYRHVFWRCAEWPADKDVCHTTATEVSGISSGG